MLRLHNTLTRRIEDFVPLEKNQVRIYSCGPTVYNHAHIGNLASYVFADLLRRIVAHSGYTVRHVMNITDVDDKTIRDSKTAHPKLNANQALMEFTRTYEAIFYEDMAAIGTDLQAISFVRATESIEAMQSIIRKLHAESQAYISSDGVYFDIRAYSKSHTYGQLSPISAASTSNERIDNDEYDKDTVHDFALWKRQKPNEPAWPFELDGTDLTGRPGWHIECSAMSTGALGQPFDIHTGGIDLIFPHHENEIAQSTAGNQPDSYARYFCHNEHLLIEGRKMSKSLGNFYTLQDIIQKGFEPMALRMLVLQSHYRSQLNFSWDNISAAQNRLKHWQATAELRWQTHDTLVDDDEKVGDELTVAILQAQQDTVNALQDDMNTPAALRIIEDAFTLIEKTGVSDVHHEALSQFLASIDSVLGLGLLQATPDIADEIKMIILERERAREAKDWKASDKLRDKLLDNGIQVRDTSRGAVWFRS